MTRKILACSAAAVALVGSWQPAMAQGDSSDIIVTARRVEERLQDVPISITAFSQQQLANRNIVSAGDIATYTPSLSANSRFGPEKTSFSIRGFNQDNGTSPSVGVYFADVPALRSIGGTTTGNGAGPGSFFDLANVQVLKGPQGTLFGRNTSGGAVLLVPQKPTGEFGGYIEGSVGNYEMRRLQAVVNVPILDTLRIRLGLDRQTRDGYMKNVSGIGPGDFNDIDYWAARFSVVADLTPNLENYFVASYSKSDTQGFLPRLFACDQRSLTLVPTNAANEVTKLGCAQVARGANRDFHTGESAIQSPYQHIQQWQIINTTTWKAADSLTIKNIVSYGEFREALRATVYGENYAITSGPNAGQSALQVFSNPFEGRNTASLSTFTEELQLQGTHFADRLNWQAGAYLEVASPLGWAGTTSSNTALCSGATSFQCTSFTPSASIPAGMFATPSLTARSNKYAFQDYGLYAQGTYKLSDQLSLTGGVRYTRDNYQVSSRQLTFAAITTPPSTFVSGFRPVGTCLDYTAFGNPGTAGNAGNRSEEQCGTYARNHSSAITWLADIDYKPSEDVLVYAKYARGYRQGGLKPEGYSLAAFAPEKIDAYEIGLKTTWRGAIRGTFNVAAFYNDFSNQQVSSSGIFSATGLPAGITLTPAQLITNVGKSRIQGVEVDASLTPFQGFQIDLGYAYLDTKVKEIATLPAQGPFTSFVPGGARVDYPLTFVPKNKVTATATYTLPLDESIGKISIGGTFTHVDAQGSSYQAFDCQFGTVGQLGTGSCNRRGVLGYDIGRLPALDLVNLNLNWSGVAGAPVDLAVFVTNLTNERYYGAVFGGYTTFGIEGGSTGEPRMYGVRLKYRFGS